MKRDDDKSSGKRCESRREAAFQSSQADFWQHHFRHVEGCFKPESPLAIGIASLAPQRRGRIHATRPSSRHISGYKRDRHHRDTGGA
jgi:hypothetical protein